MHKIAGRGVNAEDGKTLLSVHELPHCILTIFLVSCIVRRGKTGGTTRHQHATGKTPRVGMPPRTDCRGQSACHAGLSTWGGDDSHWERPGPSVMAPSRTVYDGT